jgi:SAM-dependent methyltransferase
VKHLFEKVYHYFFKKNSYDYQSLDLRTYAFQTKVTEMIRILPEERIFRAEYNGFKIAKILENMAFKQFHLLDFGCQDGLTDFTLQYLMPHSIITGVDISKRWVKFANRHFQPVSFLHCKEAPPLPFGNATFDVIIALEVFHHIDKTMWERHLQDFIRLLKPGGIVLILELNPYNGEVKRSFENNPFEKKSHLISPWHIKKLMSGYGATKLHFFNFFPRSELLRPLEKYLTKLPLGQQYACILTKNSQ